MPLDVAGNSPEHQEGCWASKSRPDCPITGTPWCPSLGDISAFARVSAMSQHRFSLSTGGTLPPTSDRAGVKPAFCFSGQLWGLLARNHHWDSCMTQWQKTSQAPPSPHPRYEASHALRASAACDMEAVGMHSSRRPLQGPAHCWPAVCRADPVLA